MSNCQMREALEQIAQTLEDHPLYMGAGHTEEDFVNEGGDAATITEMAYVARAALAAQAPAPVAEPIGYADAESLKWLADHARYPGAKITTTLYKRAIDGADVAVYASPAPAAIAKPTGDQA